MSTIVEVVGREVLDSRGNPTVEVEVELLSGRPGAGDRPERRQHRRPRGRRAPRRRRPLRRQGRAHRGRARQRRDRRRRRRARRLRPAPARRRAGRPRRHRRQGPARRQRDPRRLARRAPRPRPRTPSCPLYRYVGGANAHVLPVPFMNVLNGGAHADSNVDVQEFMLAPVGAASFAEALRWGVETYHALKALLKERGPVDRARRRRWLRAEPAVERGGARAAARRDRACGLHARRRDRARARRRVHRALRRRPLRARGRGRRLLVRRSGPTASCSSATATRSCRSRTAWRRTTGTAGSRSPQRLGTRVQLVGDDLFVTNVERLERGIELGVANSILVKVNQIGTLSETLDTMFVAGRARLHRDDVAPQSGETEDATIADLAVATNCGQIKTGAPARSDRVAKYNQLLRIEEELGPVAAYLGRAALPGTGRVADHKRVRSGPARPAPPRVRREAAARESREPHASHGCADDRRCVSRAVPRRARRPAVRVRVPDAAPSSTSGRRPTRPAPSSRSCRPRTRSWRGSRSGSAPTPRSSGSRARSTGWSGRASGRS